MTPTRSRTIALALATLALAMLAAGPALGALSASPNPSITGSYTVSDASPPALSADVVGGVRSTLYSYNLVETPSGGTAVSYGLGRGPVSKSFTDKSVGTYSYQLQTCVDVYELDGFDFEHISNTCTDSGSALTVTVGAAPPPDLMPDFGTASVSAKSWKQNTAITSFTVPAATGGDTPLSYSASGLPAGVSMSSARLVSGTPTAAGSGTATVTVTDDDDDTDTLTFTWTVAADLVPDFGTASVSAKSWTQNSAITAFTVPAATGGDTRLTYTASGLPTGVSMSSARLVSGTPTAAGSGTATVTASDVDGDTDTLSFDWTVTPEPDPEPEPDPDLMPDFGTASVTAKSWTQNAAITAFTVPAATGGDTPLSYTATGLPAGVTMSSTRRVSGTPTASGSGTATVTVTDDDGDTDTLTFDWTVAADLMPDFGTASVSAKRWTRNTAITAFTVPAATGGDTPLSYTTTGLPAGVTMSSARRVSGTPTATGTGTATVTVSDDDGDTDTLSFTWTVTAPPTTGGLTASPNPSTTGNYTVSHASPPALPTDTVTNVRQTLNSYNLVETPTGGTAQSYGLGRGPVSKSFTGKSSGTYAYQLQTCVDVYELDGFDFTHISNTCTNSGSSLSVTVTAPDRMPDYSGVTVAAKNWTQNTAITAFTVPAATGGDAPLSYAATGLPTGITMSSAREVSGTPTASGSGTATVTVTDDDGDTDTLTFGWRVDANLIPDYSGVTVTEKSWILNSAIIAFTVDEASGGDTPLSYTVSGLPAGVTMSNARRVSGTPTATGSGSAIVTVTDNDGDTDTLTFAWTVETDTAPVFPVDTLISRSWNANAAIAAFTVPSASGGNAPLTYTASGLPSGVSMSSARVVSGTPTTTGRGTATVTVTDADGDTATLTFTWAVVTVNGGLTASPNPSGTGDYTVSHASPPTLPADQVTNVLQYLNTYNLVETPPGGTAQSHGLGRGPVSKSFTGKSSGTYVYQLQTCVDTYEFDGSDFVHRNAVCTNSGSSLSVTVDLIPDFSGVTVVAKSWTQNTAITAFTVPAATGGDEPLSYAATGLPTGITMASAREVSGTPTVHGSGSATVTVTDNDGDTDTLTFDWTVDMPETGTATNPHLLSSPLQMSALNAFGLLRGAGSGDSAASATYFRFTVPNHRAGTWSIAIDGTPNSGVNWDLKGDGSLSGTSANADESGSVTLTAGQQYNFRVYPATATARTSLTGLTLTLSAPPCPAPTAPKSQTWIEGVAITGITVPEFGCGAPPVSYSASGLPTGVTMSSARRVSGTPMATDSGTAVVTMTDSNNDTDTLSFDWKVEADTEPMFPVEVLASRSWNANAAITAFTVPAASGGNAPLTYTASGLPSGVSMSSARVVSGTPISTGTGTATVTVTDADGDTATLKFTWAVTTVNGGLTASPNPSGTGDYTVSHASPPALPADQVTNVLIYLNTYNLVETPPAGAAQSHDLDQGPVEKSFTGKSSGTYVYQLQTCVDTFEFDGSEFVHRNSACTNSGNSLSVTVDLRPDYSGVTVSAQNWTQNQAITAFTVDEASGGDMPLSYAASGLPAGVTMSSARQVSGTPTVSGSGTATVTATDNDDDTATLTFDWTVAKPEPGTVSNPHLLSNPLQTSALNAFSLLRGTGDGDSDASATYFRFTVPNDRAGSWRIAIDGTPDSGANWDLMGDGDLSSTGANADESGSVTLTAGQQYNFRVYPATATARTSLTAMTVRLTAPPSTIPMFPDDPMGPYTWKQNKAITAFAVPAATGGNAPLTYSVTGLPTGLTMSTSTLQISGTPATIGEGMATVTVSDSDGDSDTLSFDWTVTGNRPPVANPGMAQTVDEDAPVTLDGSGSSDPDNDPLTYEWSQTSGTTVTLSSTTAANPTFTAPNLLAQGTLVFSLTVNDGTVDSQPSSVTITVNADNDPPTAEAGDDQTVRTGQQVTLDGTDSSDPEGQALHYEWSVPAGSGITLSSTTASSPTFTAPSTPTTLEFTLSVKDAPDNTAVKDTVTVTVVGTPPVPGAIDGPATVTVGAYTLTWTASDTSQSVVYELERSVDGATWTLLSGTNSMTTRSITGHSTPGPHSFRVRACLETDRTSCSDWTDAHTVTFLPPGALIAVPPTSKTGDYTVSWTPVSEAAYYRLLENTGGETWQLVRETLDTTHHFTGRDAGAYRYQLEMCFDNPLGLTMTTLCWESNWSPITVTVTYDTEVALRTNTVAGTLPYDAGVTRGGDAYINIPIEPVPGVNGLEPMLSIDYSGGRERTRMTASLPGDTLGYGWQVSGFSTIRRCIKNQAADATLGIDDTASLCLDGEPLIKVSGSHMRSGAQYRTLRESFARIEIKGPTEETRTDELWFEVEMPDGSVREYGNTEDSRLRHMRYVPVAGTNRTTEDPTPVYLWSINKQTDAFGNTMSYSYLEDERNAVRHPARIAYGAADPVTHVHDAVIAFQYASRSDLSAVNIGTSAQRQDLRLHTVQVNLGSRTVRTYRFKSVTTAENWQRLDKIQLCGYDATGTTPECLEPVALEWMKPTRTTPGTLTAVSKITDPLGRYTAFDYDTLTASGTHTFLFSERPFGTPATPAEVAALTPAPENAPTDGGALKSLVIKVRRSNGIGGEHETRYAYHGRGFVSSRHWGYLGFYATRETDVASGIVTYHQYRLDYPYYGELAAVHQYVGAYTSSAQVLSKRAMDHAIKTIAQSDSVQTVLPYVERATDWHYEGATQLGATQRHTQITLQSALVGSVTETVTTGHSVSSSAAGTVWGDQPTHTVGGIQRKTVSTVSLNNLTSNGRWLIGFASGVNVAHHKGASATAERSQSASFTRFGNTNRVDTVTRFATDTQYRLVTDYGYTSKGLQNRVAVSGANVASRTTSVSSFSNSRYPASVSNALGHTESFSYDARFGLPTRYTDANNRITRMTYDAFGREKTRTTPDGVVITTAYGTCPSTAVRCPSIAGVTPAMWVSRDSSISPKAVEYLDVLGRAIHTEVEAFSGAAAYREHTIYDNRGRVKSVSEPYTSAGYNASAPKTTYTYDVRDRITGVTPADGGSTAIAYAAQSNNQVKVTETETLSGAATGTPTTQTTERYYNVLGELVKTVDGHGAGATDTVTTTHTYDGSGLADTVTVGSLVTDFDHDVAGNRSRVVHPNLGTVTFGYTALGELRQKTDAAGTTTNTHDLLGRLTKRNDPTGLAQWSYDPPNGKGSLGSRCYFEGASATGTTPACGGQPGFKETLAYNPQSRVESSTAVLRAGGYTKTYVHRHTYDSSGRLLTTAYPTGLTVRSVYNARGYLESLRDNAAANTAAALEMYGSLNAYGQVTQESYANGVTTTRVFDANSGRLTGIDTVQGARKLQDNDYAWQSNGILRSRVSNLGGTAAKRETFRYDVLDRLKTATATLSGHPAGRTLSMSYDKLGNLKAKTSSVSGDTDATAYAYGTSGTAQPSLTTLSSVSLGGVSHTLTHDASGRVTKYDSSGSDRYLGWNGRHLPTTVTVGDSLADTTPKAKDELLYGPDGAPYYKKSTWEVTDATTMTTSYPVEHTFYAGTHREVIRVGDAANSSVATSSVTATVLHIRTTPVSGSPTTSFEYLHRDHLGSVESVTDGMGAELKVQAYDPFGERRADDWTRAMTDAERTALAGEAPRRTARGYTGHEHLERTGLIHMNGRVHDPAIGRFLSPDPIVADASFSQSWNAYSYALNSPLSYSDPSGLTFLGGCPPALCPAGAYGAGRGGYGPGSVLATSRHQALGVVVSYGLSYGFGYFGGFSSSPLQGGLDSPGGAFGYGGSPISGRLSVQVHTYRVPYDTRQPINIGEEQGPADQPMDRQLLSQESRLSRSDSSVDTSIDENLIELLEGIQNADKIADAVLYGGMILDVVFGGPTGEGVIIGAVAKGATNKAIKKSMERILRQHGTSSLRKARRSFQKRLDEHSEKLGQIKREGGYTSSVEREIRTFERHIKTIDEILDKL